MALKHPSLAKVYEPPEHCAYCPSTEGLTNEHIIAYGLGGEAPDWNHWVSGYARPNGSSANTLHELKFLLRGNELSVIVHLFVPYCPNDAYEVVVGRLRPDQAIPPDLLLD